MQSSNLPLRLTEFVEREREIDEVEGLLSDHRLLGVPSRAAAAREASERGLI